MNCQIVLCPEIRLYQLNYALQFDGSEEQIHDANIIDKNITRQKFSSISYLC